MTPNVQPSPIPALSPTQVVINAGGPPLPHGWTYALKNSKGLVTVTITDRWVRAGAYRGTVPAGSSPSAAFVAKVAMGAYRNVAHRLGLEQIHPEAKDQAVTADGTLHARLRLVQPVLAGKVTYSSFQIGLVIAGIALLAWIMSGSPVQTGRSVDEELCKDFVANNPAPADSWGDPYTMCMQSEGRLP
jgi:hypothetical protein